MATASEYRFVGVEAGDGVARYTDIIDYGDDFKLSLCKPLVDEFPEDATIKMRPDFPDDIEVVDALHITNSYVVVSEKAKAVLEGAGVDQVEYLPVKVMNHKGRAVPGAFFVLNVLAKADCIDKGASDLEWNDIDPTMISVINALALDDARLAKAPKLFRPVHMPFAMLLEESVALAIESAGLRGFTFTPPAEFFYP